MAAERGDMERYRQLTRRTLMLGGLQAGMISLLVGRMYYLQVVDSKRYQMLAEDNRISMRLIAPSRGLIVDRFGTPMAGNDQNFRALIVSEQTPDLDRTLGVLSGIIQLTPTEIRVLLSLLDVGSGPDVAEALGVADSTVKTHLGRIYQKTGTRGQVDLVKLVAGFANPLVG